MLHFPRLLLLACQPFQLLSQVHFLMHFVELGCIGLYKTKESLFLFQMCKSFLFVFLVFLNLFITDFRHPIATVVIGICKDGVTSHGGIAPLSGLQSLPEAGEAPATNTAPPNDGQKILSTSQKLHHCNNNINNTTVPERRTFDLNNDAEPERIENF